MKSSFISRTIDDCTRYRVLCIYKHGTAENT